MKIELTIPESVAVGGQISEILQSLTPEQKLDIAKQTINDWLKNASCEDERRAYEKTVIAKILDEHKSGYNSVSTIDGARNHYEFGQRMREFKSTRDKLVEWVRDAIEMTIKATVKDTVEKDPMIIKMREEVALIVKEKFPQFAHDAILNWFMSHMSEMLHASQQQVMQATDLGKFREDLFARLRGCGLNVG